MRTCSLILLLTMALADPRTATADPAQPAAEPTRPPAQPPPSPPLAPPPPSLSHRYQFGMAVRAGSGYRVIAPFNQEFCGDKTDKGENKSVCGGRLRTWLEVSPSFGVSSGLELLVDVRFYLESDFTGTRGLFVAPGVKYYTDPESRFKFFATGQVIFEYEDLSAASVSSFDVGLRSALGLHFDVLRHLGLFVQGGVDLGFKRWLTFAVDFGAGIQGRY